MPEPEKIFIKDKIAFNTLYHSKDGWVLRGSVFHRDNAADATKVDIKLAIASDQDTEDIVKALPD